MAAGKLWLSCAFALCALRLWGLETLVLEPPQAEFMQMSPRERRDKFLDKEYRERLAQCKWRDLKWREANPGEVVRWRHLPGVDNLRDLGGLRGLDGRMVRLGRVFRSGAYNNNAKYRKIDDPKRPGKKMRQYYGGCSDRLDAAGRELQAEQFGIKTDLDLRSDGECNGMAASPLGPHVRWVHNSSLDYEGIHTPEGRAATKRSFAIFLDESNYPIGFHCYAGADRTGALAYLLEALLGVSDEDLCLDWELSVFTKTNMEFRHAERYDRLVAGFQKYPGTSSRERAEAYVRALGYSDADIEHFRKLMLQ